MNRWQHKLPKNNRQYQNPFYNVPGCVSVELKIPSGSRVVDLTVFNGHLIAIVSIPDRGNVAFIICPETGTATEINPLPVIIGGTDFLGK